MSLISWIIIAMIAVTVFAVILNIWRKKLFKDIWDSPSGVLAVECSIIAIMIGGVAVVRGQTADLVGIVIVATLAVAAIILTIVQFVSCFQRHRWNESYYHG